tara:strand:- start:620 stop:1357 length:738 start_codon:yes stop_codon:yes gene_type:complete
MTDLNDHDIEKFQHVLGFVFNDKQLLKEALTHSSYVKHKDSDLGYNERLEFFGDSVLKFVVSDYLFTNYKHLSEGELSKKRSKIVSDQFLTTLAIDIQLGEFLIMSFGERKSGGHQKDSILANAYEALLGAIYIDQGMEIVKDFFLTSYKKFSNMIDSGDFFDHKTLLQEICQKSKIELPNYRIVREEGPDHEKVFHIEAAIKIDDVYLVSQGDASNKKRAEQQAAQHILDMLSYYKYRDLPILS